MRVLVLAPHPFYQERGTPIAVDLLVSVLIEQGHSVDCLCFNEGEDRQYPGFRLHRTRTLPSVTNVAPGFSLKKVYLDIFMFAKFVKLFAQNQFDVVHAVEESAFMAMIVCKLTKTRFVYDMDSSMATQIIDKSSILKPFSRVLHWVESLPMRSATVVVPVCQALADNVSQYRETGIFLLKDISLVSLKTSDTDADLKVQAENLRVSQGIDGPIVMYIGNLEGYQGIDLLLEAFGRAAVEYPDARLVLIGGDTDSITRYQEKVALQGTSKQVIFLGKRPVAYIDFYMKQADLLVSPRTQGVNTPLKLYSYLDSGVAVLATRLPTHTQVVDDNVAFLASDDPESFGNTMALALGSATSRCEKAEAAKHLIESEHSLKAFSTQVSRIYSYLQSSENT